MKTMLLKYGDACYSISVEKSCGNILFGCGNTYLIYNSALQYVRHGTSGFNVLSLCSLSRHNKIYYLNSHGTFVCVPLDNLDNAEAVFSTTIGSSKRIAVNDELKSLETLLEKAPNALVEGGKLAIISFHSLEDRIVKHSFKDSELLKVLTKKPIIAQEEEISINPRSRSAKLRIAESVTSEQ